MGNLNQRPETNYGDYLGPNGIIPNFRMPSQTNQQPHIEQPPTPIVEEKPAVEETLPTENKPLCCAQCNKKLGMYQYQCRCQKFYCLKHMHSFDHQCTFDYKKFHQEQLIKDNPKIAPGKIGTI